MDDTRSIPITLSLAQADLAALDEWIARHDDPKPTRATALLLLIRGVLGSHAPSTTIPGIVTGRDIV